MANIFCTTSVPDYVAQDCGIEQAGIVGVALVDQSENPSESNLENATYWTNELAASPQTHWVIQNTRGEYNGGTPVEEEGFGTESTQITGADHEAMIEVEGIADNRNFWEGVNRRKWKVALVTNAGLLLWIESPVTVYAKIFNPKNIKASAFWQISMKWQSYDNPKVYTAPDGIFT